VLIVLLDRSGTHRCKEVHALARRFRHRLVLEHLPPYAPEINPQEYVWHHLKYHRLANHGAPAVAPLHRAVRRHASLVQTEQNILWSCIRRAGLPLRQL
jgi:hypothetical protein